MTSKVTVLPPVSERVETGAVQFGADWPGLFMRGKHCFFFSSALEDVINNHDFAHNPLARIAVLSLLNALQLPVGVRASVAETPVIPVLVSAAFILHEGKLLISCRAGTGSEFCSGLWELPGGKVEPGELPEDAAVREIREELGIDIRVKRLLPYANTEKCVKKSALRQYVVLAFECELVGDPSFNLDPEASSEVLWIDPAEIANFRTMPGTEGFVQAWRNIQEDSGNK